jgi:hypothetical protein
VPGCTIGDASASNRNLRSARILAVSAVYLRPWALPCSRMVGRWSGTVGEAAESTTMPCYQLGPVATFDVGLICMPHLRHINGLPDPRNPLLRLDIRFTGLTGLPGVAAIPPAFASWPPHSFIHHPVSTFLPEQDRSAYQQTLGDSIANLIAPTPPGIRLASEGPIWTQPRVLVVVVASQQANALCPGGSGQATSSIGERKVARLLSWDTRA